MIPVLQPRMVPPFTKGLFKEAKLLKIKILILASLWYSDNKLQSGLCYITTRIGSSQFALIDKNIYLVCWKVDRYEKLKVKDQLLIINPCSVQSILHNREQQTFNSKAFNWSALTVSEFSLVETWNFFNDHNCYKI